MLKFVTIPQTDVSSYMDIEIFRHSKTGELSFKKDQFSHDYNWVPQEAYLVSETFDDNCDIVLCNGNPMPISLVKDDETCYQIISTTDKTALGLDNNITKIEESVLSDFMFFENLNKPYGIHHVNSSYELIPDREETSELVDRKSPTFRKLVNSIKSFCYDQEEIMLLITDLDLYCVTDKTKLSFELKITTHRPGVIIGVGGETIDGLIKYLNERFKTLKIEIVENTLWL